MVNKYIIKNLTPWMIDELKAFSEITSFEIIFLRKQNEMYDKDLQELTSRGVRIHFKPWKYTGLQKKLRLLVKFVINNISRFGFNYNGVIGLKSIIWFFKLDISIFSETSNIHAQFATQPALIALLVKKFYSDKTIYSFTFHAYDIFFKNKWFDLLTENSLVGISISQFNIEYVKKKYDVNEKISLIRLGVFREKMKVIKKERKSDNFNFGLMSWFVEKKGVIYLLKAVKIIKSKGYKDIKLILAGDGPLINEYESFIEKNDLSDMISFKGTLKGKEKEDFYSSIHAFILPSISLKNDRDGIPVVLMEAIAHKLPIISTNVSGIPEVCINNYNGFLVDEKSVNDLVDSMLKLYKNKNNQIEFSKNSYLLSESYDIRINSKNKIQRINWNY